MNDGTGPSWVFDARLSELVRFQNCGTALLGFGIDRRRKLLLDGFFEGGFGLGAAHKDAIDEKSRCSADACPHALLAILLNLSLELLGRDARVKLLRV